MASDVRHTRYSGEHDKKKDSIIVTFYKNGDIYFKGYSVTITPRRFRSFEVLLSELSRVTNLPQGVRYLLDRESGGKIEALEQLQDGKAYVCASNSKLKRLAYGKKDGHLPQWSSRNKLDLPALTNPPRVGTQPGTQSPGRVVLKPATRRVETKERRPDVPKLDGKLNFKARNVTVIRNGNKPRITCRVLLNKRTAITVNQFMDLVNDSLGVTGSSNVRKLYTSKGKQIYEVSDLFNDEEGVFIAVGNERFRVDDIVAILSSERDNNMHKPAKKTSKNHHRVYSNDGMDKHTREQEKQDNYRKVVRPHANQDNNSLPKIQDTNDKDNINSNNYLSKNKGYHNETNKASLSSPKTHRKQVQNKQNQHFAKENKPVEKTHEENSNSVKLPAINGGHNLVSKTNENQEQKTRKTSKTKKDSTAKNISGVGDGDGNIESHENHHGEAEEKPHKRVSKGSTQHEQELEYGRVTDKKVEDVYIIGKKIGDGNFAVVRQCTSKATKKEFALKIIDKRKIAGKEKMIDDEIAIMRKCRHPNIVRLFEDYDTPTEMFLVMEFVKGGDLFDAISASVKFSENVAKDYFRDMTKALHYLHKQNIVHRDLKPENLLVSIISISFFYVCSLCDTIYSYTT